MKYKFNPLTGEFNLVPDSGTLKQKLNWLTGNFNLTKDASKYKQIYNIIEGEFNLYPATTQVIVHGVGSVQLTNAVENGLLSLTAFGGTEQSNLPKGYTQLDYITLNKSFFDTGITPTTDTDYEIKFTIAQNNTTQGAMGMLNNSTPTNNFYFMVSSGNKFLSALGTSAITLNDLPAVAVDTDYLVKVDGETLTVNGTAASNFNRGTLEATQTIDLGCRKNSENNGLTGKLYYFKIWKGGELVAHYIPCKRNSDDVLGYYDIVNDTFGVLLTQYGTPVAGPDIVPTPSAPMDIVCNNGALKAIHQSGLPIGYTLLDYIQSGGNNYIDTGIKITNEDIIEMQYLQTADKGAIYGEYYNGTANMSTTLYGNITFYFYPYNAQGTAVLVGNYDNNVHTVVHNFVDGYIDFDGVRTNFDLPSPNSFTNTLNCPIFGRSNGSSIGYFSKTQLYYFRIIRNGTPILDLIPAKDSDNNVGMYDRVSGTLFTESGTGSFTAGNTVSDPMTVYADGTTETIGVNLLDLSNVDNGHYYSGTGEYLSTATTRLSNFVPVKAGDTLSVTTQILSGSSTLNVRYNFFDTSKQWLSQSVYTLSPTEGRHTEQVTAQQDGYFAFSGIYTGSGTLLNWDTVVIMNNEKNVTAEMLLKVGDYVDEQEILSGNITRKIGIMVLDGTENWTASGNLFYAGIATDALENTHSCYCTHFKGVATNASASYDNEIKVGTNATQTVNWTRVQIYPVVGTYSNVTAFKQWLADQYNAGTPVIVVYPLNTPTTESVAGQTMNIPSGNSTIGVVQASLDNLELEATYEQEA